MQSRLKTSSLARPVPPMSATDFLDEVIELPRRKHGSRRERSPIPAERPLWIIKAIIARKSDATVTGLIRETKYFTSDKVCWFASKTQANPYEIYPSDVVDDLISNRARYLGDDASFEQIAICGVNKHLTVVTETVVFEAESRSGAQNVSADRQRSSASDLRATELIGFIGLPNTGIASHIYQRGGAR